MAVLIYFFCLSLYFIIIMHIILLIVEYVLVSLTSYPFSLDFPNSLSSFPLSFPSSSHKCLTPSSKGNVVWQVGRVVLGGQASCF